MKKLSNFFVFMLMISFLSAPFSFAQNVIDTQPVTTCPTGYTLVDNTNCMLDVCPNLPGAQAKIPTNYWIGDNECRMNIDLQNPSLIPPAFISNSGKGVYDACPNIPGVQGGVPAGYTKDTLTNKCTKKPVVDLCKNVNGIQTSLPKNHARNEDGTCYNKLTAPKPVVKVYDQCTNIAETQTSIPQGMMRPNEGTECVPIVPPVVVVDRCSNIEGPQATIPETHYQRDGATDCIAR